MLLILCSHLKEYSHDSIAVLMLWSRLGRWDNNIVTSKILNLKCQLSDQDLTTDFEKKASSFSLRKIKIIGCQMLICHSESLGD